MVFQGKMWMMSWHGLDGLDGFDGLGGEVQSGDFMEDQFVFEIRI